MDLYILRPLTHVLSLPQVVALVTLGPDHLTLSGSVLDQLAAAKESASIETIVDTPGTSMFLLILTDVWLTTRTA